MAEETFDINKAQERVITDVLQIICNAFDLNEWRKKQNGRDGTLESRYYLYKNAIWEQTAFTAHNPCECPLEELGITKTSQHQIAQSIDTLVSNVWHSELSELSHQHAERKMRAFFSVGEDEPMVRVYMWINHAYIMFVFPKSYMLSNHYPVSEEVYGVIKLETGVLSKKQILQCVFSHNQYEQEFYQAKIRYCKEIHQFIRSRHLNERLNLESPPFSPELYKIRAPIILDYQDAISPFLHANRSLP